MSPDPRWGIPLAEQLGVLEALKDEGKIESIGLSNAAVGEVASALEVVDLGEVQNAFNIMLRDDEDVLRFCAERDIAYVPFFPIGSPFAGGPRPLAADSTISAVAAMHGANPRRSPWRGFCTGIGTFCSSRAPRLWLTSRRTWPSPGSCSTTTT